MNKINVGVIFGGKSSEHKISLLSVKNIVNSIDKNKFKLTLFGVSERGQWQLFSEDNYLCNSNDPTQIHLADNGHLLSFKFTAEGVVILDDTTGLEITTPDVMLSIIHGSTGEDGVLQGFLTMLGIPYVGSKVLGSALCMDKAMAKQVLAYNNVAVAPFILVNEEEIVSFDDARAKLGLPLFIKPSREGSSVGVHKVNTEQEYVEALEDAFKYDSKVLIEMAIVGKEIECAILGIKEIKASICGQIITDNFYSFDSKYIDPAASKLLIPADVDDIVMQELQELAIKIYKLLDCSGLARVDFFVTADNKLILNEVNTLPGFTNISMYPKLWNASGIGYADLITKLIMQELA